MGTLIDAIRLAREAPAFVPWAWGLNGCASVVAAVAALLLALEVGLTLTLVIAMGLYVLAAVAWTDFPQWNLTAAAGGPPMRRKDSPA